MICLATVISIIGKLLIIENHYLYQYVLNNLNYLGLSYVAFLG